MKKVIEYINSVSPISNNTVTDLESIFTFKKLKKDEIFINNGSIAKKVGLLETGSTHSSIPYRFLLGYHSYSAK